jgi:hypothetical protein
VRHACATWRIANSSNPSWHQQRMPLLPSLAAALAYARVGPTPRECLPHTHNQAGQLPPPDPRPSGQSLPSALPKQACMGLGQHPAQCKCMCALLRLQAAGIAAAGSSSPPQDSQALSPRSDAEEQQGVQYEGYAQVMADVDKQVR